MRETIKNLPEADLQVFLLTSEIWRQIKDKDSEMQSKGHYL